MTAGKNKSVLPEFWRTPRLAIFPQTGEKWASLQALEAIFANFPDVGGRFCKNLQTLEVSFALASGAANRYIFPK